MDPAPAADHGTGMSVGIIGAGVAGCALAARLRQLDWKGWIGLWEAGRGPGGRASTRRSRLDHGLAIDHGAPLFNITCTPTPLLLASLRSGGWIEPWLGASAEIEADGSLRLPSRDPRLGGDLWHGCGGMDRIAHGLLELAEEISPVERHWGHRVRGLARSSGGGWRLFNDDSEVLAKVDWLVLSGSLLAHPRCRNLLGWESVPLLEAAECTGDARLIEAVRAIGGMDWQARWNLMTVIEADRAGPWHALPFRLLSCAHGPLERMSVQPLEDGRCVVVLHSFGPPTAAQLPREKKEDESRIEALVQCLAQMLAPWISLEDCREALQRNCTKMMRWGAAFAEPPGLDPALSLCPDSRIGFCGDYIDGPGFGRIEGALHSSEGLAEAMVAAAR
jgi:predicted NAD/FAD-dependent oxidoreductase